MTPAEVFSKTLPEVFLATELDKLTHNIIVWRSIKNIRTPQYSGNKSAPPSTCFSRVGNRIVINREPFLKWWQSQFIEQHSAIEVG